MREAASLTGALPLAGKHIVKKWYQDGISAARNGHTGTMLASVGGLVLFSFMHAVQLKMGVEELMFDWGVNQVESGIDGGYVVANFLAMYTQAYLAGKVVTTKSQGYSSSSAPVSHPLGKVTPLEMGVTAGGQVLFLSTMQSAAAII